MNPARRGDQGDLGRGTTTLAPRTAASELWEYATDISASAQSIFRQEAVGCMDDACDDVRNLRRLVTSELARRGYQGVMGVAGFRQVYHAVMPVQQTRLQALCQARFPQLLKDGSILCVGAALPESAIACIDAKQVDGTMDRRTWNRYAAAYRRLNGVLNAVANHVASQIQGIPLPATIEGIAGRIHRVEEYYGRTVSHRVIAEEAGVGWRGKNELIVHDVFRCTLRFAAVLTTIPLLPSEKAVNRCGDCEACLDACPVLRHKETHEDFRESCRQYILRLQLDAEVCGKCIKACHYADTPLKKGQSRLLA